MILNQVLMFVYYKLKLKNKYLFESQYIRQQRLILKNKSDPAPLKRDRRKEKSIPSAIKLFIEVHD
jgi:hypothetical protein